MDANSRSDVTNNARAHAGVAGNVMAAGTGLGAIGTAFDSATGAAFRYPAVATVIIRCDDK